MPVSKKRRLQEQSDAFVKTIRQTILGYEKRGPAALGRGVKSRAAMAETLSAYGQRNAKEDTTSHFNTEIEHSPSYQRLKRDW
ncbi:hypothetical protein IAQ61_007789 [Plenodomus lingam]|uniref:uncharacterized protein n=1 Tax=Leptosphaeria maculans TaxID=5022 RepID=UPI00333183ED|nr:hypothetical protein IAQ61_007789 [Plenodomus lingam]